MIKDPHTFHWLLNIYFQLTNDRRRTSRISYFVCSDNYRVFARLIFLCLLCVQFVLYINLKSYFARIDSLFVRIEERLVVIEARFVRLEGQFGERFDEVERQIEQQSLMIGRRIRPLETGFVDFGRRLRRLEVYLFSHLSKQ
jgi:hypothetical protein